MKKKKISRFKKKIQWVAFWFRVFLIEIVYENCLIHFWWVIQYYMKFKNIH